MWYLQNDLTARVAVRVEAIVGLYSKEPELKGADRIAARHLFSILSRLEEIAVLAAERGDCVAGQLEDELVHREAFRRLASANGGFTSCPRPAAALISYLSRLSGEMSMATLNVVAESWLETVFESLAGCRGLASSVFKMVEDDEHRHSHAALSAARPDPSSSAPIIADLERLLTAIAVSPEFMAPMVWFLGAGGAADMGDKIRERHIVACEHLGVKPNLERLRRVCRAARLMDRSSPQLIEMNEWENLKVDTWHEPAPQLCFVDVAVGAAQPAKILATAVTAVGRALTEWPKLRNVCRGDRLYRTRHPVIGVRELHGGDKVMTVYLTNPGRKGWRGTLSALARKRKKLLNKPYAPYWEPGSGLREMTEILPPSRCNAVVSSNGSHGGLFGVGPLSNVEGVPISITIGAAQVKPVWRGEWLPETTVTLCVQMDHRVGDGAEVGRLATEVKKHMEDVQWTQRS